MACSAHLEAAFTSLTTCGFRGSWGSPSIHSGDTPTSRCSAIGEFFRSPALWRFRWFLCAVRIAMPPLESIPPCHFPSESLEKANARAVASSRRRILAVAPFPSPCFSAAASEAGV